MHRLMNHWGTSRGFKANFSAQQISQHSQRPFYPIMASSPVSIISTLGNQVKVFYSLSQLPSPTFSYRPCSLLYMLSRSSSRLYPGSSHTVLETCRVLSQHQQTASIKGREERGERSGWGNHPCPQREKLEQAGREGGGKLAPTETFSPRARKKKKKRIFWSYQPQDSQSLRYFQKGSFLALVIREAGRTSVRAPRG